MTAGEGSRDPQSHRVRIWDLPVRLFHWCLVVLVSAAWYTAQIRAIQWHRAVGYAIATLVLFRLLWGFVGSTTARFAHFVRGPHALWTYARRELLVRRASLSAGHNPLGGWNVVALLLLLSLQVGLGLFTVDVDGVASGPLSRWVSFDAGRRAAGLHHVIFNALLALIGLHLAALVYYRVHKRESLVRIMLTGVRFSSSPPAPEMRFVSLRRALGVFVLSLVCVIAVVFGAGD